MAKNLVLKNFVSHFESDECGGLSYLLEHFSEAKTICSQVTALQLKGFGLLSNAMSINHGEVLATTDFTLKFVSYPSEMHLWEGLMAFEEKQGLLFSSDLFIRRGQSGNHSGSKLARRNSKN